MTLTVLLLEQTVVTAARTGEADVQTVPMAVTVLPGNQLARMQDHTVQDIAGRAPGLTVSQNTGRAQVTIRGIGTNSVLPGSDPSSAVYLDGVYLARPAMALADFLDLDRVEVLRGPQGTLYGRNSLGGAINLITKAPTSDKEAAFRVVGGTDGTVRADARVSGPIIPGRLMGSGAILRGVRTGTVLDLNHPDHPLGGEDVIGARGQLRLVLNRRSELLVSGDTTHSDPTPLFYSKILAVKPGFQVDNPTELHDVRASFPAEGHTFQSGASARFTVDLSPSIRATSLSAYRSMDYDALADTDISELDLTLVAPPRNPAPILRRSHCRVAGFAPDMARGPVSLRRGRSPAVKLVLAECGTRESVRSPGRDRRQRRFRPGHASRSRPVWR